MAYALLTRSESKDVRLRERLDGLGVPYLSVPLLEHAPGPDAPELPERLGESWDWVVVTSPTAAGVLLSAWRDGGEPALRLAAIGKGTARALAAGGLLVEYTAPQAYGSYLAKDLGGGGRVLWPTSTLAGDGLENILAERGFVVVRLDVYDTIPRNLSQADKELLCGAALAALASPSAVRAWVQACRARPPAAAIGRVSARAAEQAGFAPVVYPEQPGVEGWAKVIAELFQRVAGAV